MKHLAITCSLFLLSFCAIAQKNDCKTSIVTDDFTGKKKIYSKNHIIIEKLYLGEALLGASNKDPWRVTIGFWKTDGLVLCVKHESNGFKETARINSLDIKFDDGKVLTLDEPMDGQYKKGTLTENTHQSTFFAITPEQLAKFTTSLITKTRVVFTDNPNETEVEKVLNSLKAEKFRKEANCFKDALTANAK